MGRNIKMDRSRKSGRSPEVKTRNTNPTLDVGFQFWSSSFGSLSGCDSLGVFNEQSVSMGNLVDKKFTWVLKSFSSLRDSIVSDEFVIDGCKWRLGAGKGGQNDSYLSLFLVGTGLQDLPCGWTKHTKIRLTVVNQHSGKLSKQKEEQRLLDKINRVIIFREMLPLTELRAKKGGFLVNNEVEIVAEVEVIDYVAVSKASQVVAQPLKRTKLNGESGLSSHVYKESSSVKECMNVNGFQVLPSQVESVKRIFDRHPDMALEFRAKSQHLRTSCMNVLLNLIETLCQSLQDLSSDDLGQAEKALTYLKCSGFKVDWLERKLEEVKEKKNEEQTGEARIQELEEELKIFQKKFSDIKALLEKEKAKVLAARAPPLTLDDVV